MTTLLIALGAFFGYLIAYHTYGRWLARKIFRLDPEAVVPSVECRDDIDYCPTNKQVIFGHHYTSIAGTGPIVGPAIAVFWGWLPALLWVVFGAIFIGAVHDFGALVVSLRNRGQTVGEVAGRMIAPRTKYLFLAILLFALTLVLAIFGLVIATIFSVYPGSVFSVWFAMPVAVAMGFWAYKFKGKLLFPSLGALALMYLAIYVGVYFLPIQLPASWGNPVILWTALLFAYCYFASVLPVWVLLQPRDYVNSHQLVVALGLLTIGILIAGATNQADIGTAPAIVSGDQLTSDAPPIWPFLFNTKACGAVSGFHSLVSSGTTSKQIAREPDAQFVGYGAMLMEGVLAVLVIICCCAGVGMGQIALDAESGRHVYVAPAEGDSAAMASSAAIAERVTGREAWNSYYPKREEIRQPDGSTAVVGGWSNHNLKQKVRAFIDGGANFLHAYGIPLDLAIGIIAVLVASFAATTLDTATRLQRYVIQEIATATRIKVFTNRYAATGLAVTLGFSMAMLPAPGKAMGTGGMILWPLFGATNQLLAGLAFMVTFFYLWRRGISVWFIALPMCMMLVMPVWALLWQIFNPGGWWFTATLATEKGRWEYVMLAIGAATMALQIWMVIEALLMIPRAKGVLEEALPPLAPKDGQPEMAGGRSC
jgi:carbon starvation protein